MFKLETIADDNKKARNTVRLLGETWDEFTGGYEIYRCIATDFSKTFDEKFTLGSVIENKRVIKRLIKEPIRTTQLIKTKELLSGKKNIQ